MLQERNTPIPRPPLETSGLRHVSSAETDRANPTHELATTALKHVSGPAPDPMNKLYDCVDIVVENFHEEQIAYPRRERILATLAARNILLSGEEESHLFELFKADNILVDRGQGRYRYYGVTHAAYMQTRHTPQPRSHQFGNRERVLPSSPQRSSMDAFLAEVRAVERQHKKAPRKPRR